MEMFVKEKVEYYNNYQKHTLKMYIINFRTFSKPNNVLVRGVFKTLSNICEILDGFYLLTLTCIML